MAIDLKSDAMGYPECVFICSSTDVSLDTRACKNKGHCFNTRQETRQRGTTGARNSKTIPLWNRADGQWLLSHKGS